MTSPGFQSDICPEGKNSLTETVHVSSICDVPQTARIAIRLPVQCTTDRGETLLAAQQVVDRVSGSAAATSSPRDCPLTGQLLGALPQQDAPYGIVPCHRAEQFKHLLPTPDEVPLELGQHNVPGEHSLDLQRDPLDRRLRAAEQCALGQQANAGASRCRRSFLIAASCLQR